MAEIESGLDDFGAHYASVLKEHSTMQIGRLRIAITAGLDIAVLLSPLSTVLGSAYASRQRLIGALNGVADFGRQQVTQEMSRQ